MSMLRATLHGVMLAGLLTVFGCEPSQDAPPQTVPGTLTVQAGNTLEVEDVSPSTSSFDVSFNHSVSGKIWSLAASPNNRRVYAGTFSGVWRSDDGGSTWRQLTRPLDQLGGALKVPTVIDMAVSARNPDVIILGTAFDSTRAARSRTGIFRSSNGGETFTLEHQFRCPGKADPNPVSKVTFAPDDADLAYAAGGCFIAVSRDGGKSWKNKKLPAGGVAWHVAVAPKETAKGKTFRRVYAAGDGQLFYSQDAGDTWTRDGGTIPTTDFGFVLGSFPAFGLDNSSQILAVEPGHPDHVFITTGGFLRGPSYFFPGFPDGDNGCAIIGCGGSSVWLGDYSSFFPARAGTWQRFEDPAGYFGVSTPSGRRYVVPHPIPGGYLLFFADNSHVFVSEGRPASSASWHRLDGKDASQARRENNLSNQLFVHVDPMTFAASSDLVFHLRPVTDVAAPYNINAELDPTRPIAGAFLMANDGGVYRATDGGRAITLASGLSNLQPWTFGALSLPGQAPAFYLGVPDNDNFFTLDGGVNWADPVSGCGDCGPFFGDLRQTDRVLEFAGRNSPPGFNLYVSTAPPAYPNAADPSTVTPVPWPARCSGGGPPPCPAGESLIVEFQTGSPTEAGLGIDKAGYRPVVQTLTGEAPSPGGDYLVIRAKGNGDRVLLRTTKLATITAATDWDTTATEDGPLVKVFQQGPVFPAEMAAADVVQASGGHANPVFYVGDPARTNGLWTWSRGATAWRRIVPSSNGAARMALKFFVDPYRPNRLYIVDRNGIKRSENGGASFTRDDTLSDLVSENDTYEFDFMFVDRWVGVVLPINDMVFDPDESGTRFAVGSAGVFHRPDGDRWQRLFSTAAIPGQPVAGFFDRRSDPARASFYVYYNGGKLLRVGPIRHDD
jgi:hypothetical protein